MCIEEIPTIISTVNALVSTLIIFGKNRKDNINKMINELSNINPVVKLLQKDDNFTAYFYYMVEKAIKEVNDEKIKIWKNAIVNLATRFQYWDFKENFVKILESLTFFDLTVLHQIYNIEIDSKKEDELSQIIIIDLYGKGVNPNHTIQSFKRLENNNLILMIKSVSFSYDNKKRISSPYFRRNELGKEFLKFIDEN